MFAISLTDTDRAYAAGIFDGEGSVLIYRRNSPMPRGVTTPYQIRATMVNSHRAVIEQFKAWFGGSIFAYPARPKRRALWKWTALCQDAARFFETVGPFLRVKRDEADLALQMQATINRFKHRPRVGRRGQAPLPADEITYRDGLHARLIAIRAPKENVCN